MDNIFLRNILAACIILAVYIKFCDQFSVCKRFSQQSTNDKDRNGGSNNGDYGDAVVPVVPYPCPSTDDV